MNNQNNETTINIWPHKQDGFVAGISTGDDKLFYLLKKDDAEKMIKKLNEALRNQCVTAGETAI